jgi:hypothetical protein
VKGRKAWVEGHIEDTNGNVLAEAKFVSTSHIYRLPSPSPVRLSSFACLIFSSEFSISINIINHVLIDILMFNRTMFVQPKYAKLLNTKALRQAMGEPESRKDLEPVHLAKGASVPPSTT